MLKLALLIASAAAFQPRATPKVQPQTVRQFGMLDGLFKKSEADVTEKVYFDISIGGGAPQRVELGLYGDTRCINHDLRAIDATPARRPLQEIRGRCYRKSLFRHLDRRRRAAARGARPLRRHAVHKS